MNNQPLFKRRTFLKGIATTGLITAIAPDSIAESYINADFRDGDGFTFLFQGDSITDGNRTRNNDWNHVMGHGFAYIIASRLWYDFPKKGFHFFNRGVSGNKVPDMAVRWQTDTLDLMPNLLSILIGINDVSAFINGNKSFRAEQYEADYGALLLQTKKQFPDIQFVLCEPFILPVGKIKEKWNEYLSEVQKRQQSVKNLAKEFGAIHIEFQGAFDRAVSKAPADYWIWDGIHPMPAGHELMAREWIKQVKKKLRFIG